MATELLHSPWQQGVLMPLGATRICNYLLLAEALAKTWNGGSSRQRAFRSLPCLLEAPGYKRVLN